ncbi:MAG: hypothetical protein GWO28_05670 [candidate division Zixibacteria bacterium]|nr:hypothetical protein [candidate division Zixibacteria bacterium]
MKFGIEMIGNACTDSEVGWGVLYSSFEWKAVEIGITIGILLYGLVLPSECSLNGKFRLEKIGCTGSEDQAVPGID